MEEAFSGTKFTGCIPDKKDAIARFVTLDKTWDYSAASLVACEVSGESKEPFS